MDFPDRFTYEEKMLVLSLIEKKLHILKDKVTKQRIEEEGKCPHRNTKNITTLADPIDIRKEVCLDCRAILVYQDGILLEIEER